MVDYIDLEGKANAARGIALLDRKVDGWDRMVDPDTLNLGSATECVLGQIFGAYETGVKYLWPIRSFLGIADGLGPRHGFWGHHGEAKAWYEEIMLRRAPYVKIKKDLPAQTGLSRVS